MSIRNVLTRDLNESIRSCLGRAVKISMRCMVRMEVKSEKYENRVLAFSACRLFILTAKVPTRMDHHFHYMDIQALDSKCSTQFSLTVHDKKYLFMVVDDRHNEIDAMIINLGVSIKNIFPSVPLNHVVRKLEVVPPQRIQKLYEVCRLVEARDPGPCGGFSTQYACMCDYHGLPYREEVAWDVDTIYLSHDCRELNLHDFDHLDPKDLMPIISALEHNTWFTALRLSHIRLNTDSLERLLHVLKKSVSLEQIYLDNTGLKADFVHKLSMAMLSNTNCMLNVIDISHNPIEDKGAAHLAPILAKLTETPSGATHLASAIGRCSTGLQQLQLSGCALSCRGVGQLCQSLSLNRTAASTLHTLQLSANCLREESAGLLTFLAQPNSIHTLQLSSCELTLDTIFGALLRGCTSHLVRLDLSRNLFNTKKSKDLPPSFKQFFTSSMALKHINLAGCRIPLEALKHLLLGLACNESTSEVELDISGNALAASGAHVLESCIHGIKCLSSLDLSDNGLEQDVCGVVAGVSRNRSLKSLNISHNIGQLKTKHMRLVVESIVQMIQDEECALESLHVSDSRFKSELFALLNALGSNNCLQMLDISGNGMGDTGARLLAKALQINSRLRQINLDKNGVTIQGYSDIAYGLQSNTTLTYIPTPLSDLGACCKISAERSDVVWRRIEDLLHRNSLPPHSQRTSRQAFRLQQGFLLSSTQQMVDRLVGQIRSQAHHNQRASALLLSSSSSLPGSPTSSTAVDVDGAPLEAADSDLQLTAAAAASSAADARQQLLEHAEAVCQDAENSKQLLSRFHGIVTEREDAGNPVEQQLSSAVDDIHSVIVQHIEGTVSLMLDEAQQQCRRVLSPPVRAQMAGSCAERVRQARDDTHRLLMQCAGQQLAGQLQQLQLAAAAQLSDRVVDEVIATLTRTHRTLTGDLSCKRTSTPDVLKSHSRSTSASTIAAGVAGGSYSCTAVDSNSCYSGDTRDDSTASHASELTPPATPQLQAKKLNMLGRKLRPNSVVDFVEGVSADRIPDLLNDGDLASVEELDSVSELPGGAVSGGILRHLGKARPRRSKTRAPTRAAAAPSAIGSDVDAGIHSFFSSTATTSSLPGSPLTSPDADLSSSRLLMTTSADNTPNLGVTSRGLRHSASTSSTHQHRPSTEETDPPRERRGSSLRKGISSVFSKLASDRVARSRGDRDGSHKKSPKTSADSHASGADNFLNHLLTPVTAPAVTPGGGDENHSCPATAAPLRRSAAASSDQLLAEMRCKQQEKRISTAVPSTVDETPAAPSSPLSRPTAQLPAAPRARPRPAPRTAGSSSDAAADAQPVATPNVSVDATPNSAAAADDAAACSVGASGKPCLPGNGNGGRLPPIAPKPRPKSLADVTTASVPVAAPSDDVDDGSAVDVTAAAAETTSSRSVRQMAAQLNKNKPTDTATADGVGVASAGDRRSRRLVAADILELEGSSADGPRSLPSIYVSAERRPASPSSAPYCSDEVINV